MRYNMRPGTSYNTIGFRIVREVPSADLAAVKAAEQPPQPGQPLMTSIGMELVYIPPGEFMMGSTAEAQTWALANGAAREKVKYEGEQPRRAMIRHAFWLGRTEVTVKQWKQFVDATGYKTDAEKSDRTTWRAPRPDYRLADNDPVRCMSWNDAMAFCAWLNEREQAGERLPPGCQMRLPTEAEWECACRAGTQTKFWWGDSEQDAAGRCNLRGTADGFEFVSPVDHYGARGRNPVGLADMLGNVWEYCLDAFDAKGAHEELFADSSGYKVWRGGAFTNPACYTRCASRDAYIPNMSWSDHGFRVCCGVEPTKATVKVTVKDETQPATNAVVNLLPLIDPKADTISGIWTLRNCELISEGSGEGRRIEVPYQPPDEYDLCAVFTRITGKAGHVQILSQAGRCFQWWVGGSAESILVSGAILVIVHLRFSREDWRLDADIAPWSKFARTALERFWTASSLCNGMVTLRVGR